MSLDNIHLVDFLGLEDETGDVVLTVVDAWDWSAEREHLLALQEKINVYLEFVETGQIYEACPQAKGRAIRIDVISRFPIPNIALALLQEARKAASQLDILITHRVRRGATEENS